MKYAAFRQYHVAGLLALLLLLGTTARPASAQSVVTGTVIDAGDQTPLPGANVVATRLAPDSSRTGVATSQDGSFRLSLQPGTYQLRISFVGFVTDERRVTVGDAPVALGRIALAPDQAIIGEVVVRGVQERVLLRGDTTVYNADAFKVNPDASAQDLVAKMPGVVVQDGSVQAQGETVRRVLIDGEEFFGDDPAAALRNLPAEIIQAIEVFDRQSDQARFTGFDDGNTEKTINVITRPGMQNGQFGRVFGGYGTDERYLAGGTMNVFDGTRRISVIGLANNVNQQNFASEDLAGALDAGGGRRGGPPGGGGGWGGPGGRGGGPPGGGGGWGGPGGNAGDFLVGERGGINRTNALGINYMDRWGKRVRVNGSYFLNQSDNTTNARLDREYLAFDATGQRYGETNESGSENLNHRLNLRIEADLSDATALTVTPRLSLQHASAERFLQSASALASGDPLNQTTTAYESGNLAYTASTNVLLRHRFRTRGRTLSANVGINLDGRRGDTEQDVRSVFFDASGSPAEDVYSRQTDSDGWGRRLSARLAYTEPVGKRGMLQFDYRPTISGNTSDQEAFLRDTASDAYTIPDDDYTSDAEGRVITQRGGASYQYRTERFSASAGLDLQHERLRYEQTGRRAFEVDRSYLSLLPNATVQVDLSKTANLRLSYRPSTSTPGANQLRDVIDDENPLLITTGNPDLQTSTTHRVDLRLRTTRRDAGATFMAFANLTTTRDYIGTATFMAERDSVQVRGVTLAPGAQLSHPVNLQGYWNARTFVMLGRPVGWLRSNANASAGVTYARTPSLINGALNHAGSVQLDGRIFLGSNISERLDFSLSYGLSYTTVSNTTTSAQDRSYHRHRAGFQGTWLPWRGLVLTSDLNLSHYSGLSASVDPTTVLWNVGVGYKFLRNDLAEVRLTVTDLLNQNVSVNRDVTGLYVEDRETNALGRYVMLNLIYKLRQFGAR